MSEHVGESTPGLRLGQHTLYISLSAEDPDITRGRCEPLSVCVSDVSASGTNATNRFYVTKLRLSLSYPVQMR